MMLSVMVVGAGAAFSDQSKIKNTEAVDACTALNIIGGYPDGSFKPEGNITRAEVTKMICVALNGGKNPAVSTNTTPTFSDVRNNANAAWAEGYIESCAAQGIVSGVGGGKFAPNGNVPGVQLAKMLLVSLGYKSENEGFTGNACATNVNVRAAQKGLYDGLEKMDTNAAITRDNAAQMVWNALQAYEVEYKTNLVAGADGKLSTQVTVQDKVVGSNNDKITLLRDKYDAWVSVGTLISVDGKNLQISMTSAAAAASDYSVTKNKGTSYENLTFTKLDQDYSALLGQKIKVVFKNGKTNDVIGVYATGDNNSYTVNASDVENDKGDIKFNDKTYKVELNTSKKLDTYVDGKAADGKSVAELVAMNNTANILTLIDTDDNDKIDTVYVKTVTVEKVTYASSSQIVAGGKTYKYADENIASGVKKDDWVVISENNYNDNKDITIAEKKTGVAIQGTKGDAPNYTEVRIDGTWYYVAAGKSLKDIKAGNTADVVVVNGVLFDAKKTSGTSAGMPDVLMVLAKGTGLDNNKIKFILPDGTIKTEEFNGAINDPEPGTVYAWEMDGSKYKLSALGDNTSTDTDDYTKLNADSTVLKSAPGTEIAKDATVKYVGKSNTTATGAVEIADSAKVIIGYGANTKIVTGKQFKALTFTSAMVSALGTDKKAAAAYTSKVDGLTRVSLLFVKQTAEPSGFNTNDNYGYVVKDAYASGDNYYTFTMWNGTANVDVKTKTSGVKAGDIIGYSSIDDKSEIQDLKNYGSKTESNGLQLGSITGVNSKKDGIVFEGKSDYYDITSDTVILYVDSKASKAEEIGVKGDKSSIDSYVLDDDNDTVLKYNAKYVLSGDEVSILVVDVNGDMKVAEDDMKNITTTNIATATAVASGAVYDADGNEVTKAAKGQALTVKLTGTEAGGDFKLTVSGVVSGKAMKVAGKATVEYTFIATGSDITISTANS